MKFENECKANFSLFVAFLLILSSSFAHAFSENPVYPTKESIKAKIPGPMRTIRIDYEELKEVADTSRTYGGYLPAIVVAYNAYIKYDDRDRLNGYVITTEETKDNFIVRFTLPIENSDLVLGGGEGYYVISKATLEIIDVSFSE